MLRMFFMVVGLCVVSPLVSVGGLRRGAAVYPSDLYVDDGSAFLASLNVFEPITKALSTPLEQGIAVLWNELLLMNPHSLIRRHGSPFSRNAYSLGFYLGTRRSEVVSAVDLYVALLHKDGPAYRLMLSFVAGCLDGYSYASAVSVPLQFNSADEAVQAQFNAGLESHDPHLIHGNMCSVVESCDESVRLSLRSVAFVAGVHSAVHLQSARDAVFSTDFSIAARIEKIKSVIRLGVGADSLSDARGVGALSSPAGEATVHIPSAPPMTLEEAARHEAACARMSVCTKRDCLPVPEVRVASEERVPQEAQKLKQASGDFVYEVSGESSADDGSVGRKHSGASGSSDASQSLAEASVSQTAQKQPQQTPGGFVRAEVARLNNLAQAPAVEPVVRAVPAAPARVPMSAYQLEQQRLRAFQSPPHNPALNVPRRRRLSPLERMRLENEFIRERMTWLDVLVPARGPRMIAYLRGWAEIGINVVKYVTRTGLYSSK